MPRSGDQQPLSIDQITSFSSQVTARLDERLPRYQKIAPGVLLPDQFTPEIAKERVDFGGLVAALVYFQDLTLDLTLKGTPTTKEELASLKSRTRADIAKKYGVSEEAIPKKIKREAINETLQRVGIVYEGERPTIEEPKLQAPKVQPEALKAEKAGAKEKPVKPKWFIQIIQTERRGKDKKSPPYNVVRVNGKRIKKLDHDEEKVLLLFADAHEKSLTTKKKEDRMLSIIDIHRSLRGEPEDPKKITQDDYLRYAKFVNQVVAGLRDKIKPSGKKPWPIVGHREHTTHLRDKFSEISSSYVLSDEVIITRTKAAEVKQRREWAEKVRKSDRQSALAILLDGWTAGVEIDPKYIITVLPRVRGRQEKELTPIQAANSLTMHIISLCDPQNNASLDKLDRQELEGLIKLMRPNETLFEVVGRIYTLFGQDPQKFRLPRTGKNAKYMDYLEGLVQRTRSWFAENHPLLKVLPVAKVIEAVPGEALIRDVTQKMMPQQIEKAWQRTISQFHLLARGDAKQIKESAAIRFEIHSAMRKIKEIKGGSIPIEFANKLIRDGIFIPTTKVNKQPALSRSEIAAIDCLYARTKGGKSDLNITNEEFTALIFIMRLKLNEMVQNISAQGSK